VFGGPEFLVEYVNGDRTSYVMSVFEATSDGEPSGRGRLLEVRFVGPGAMPGRAPMAGARPEAVFAPRP
jgi:hypothetical protein